MSINISSFGYGSPVVFFHGWGFDSKIWLSLVPKLSEHYTVILIDLPGFGFTPVLNWDEFKNQLLTLLPEHFALVGWSLGGFYATRLSIENPNRVTHLFNVTNSPRFMADISWPGVTKESLSVYYANLSRDPSRAVKEFLSLQMGKIKVEFSVGQTPSKIGLENGLDILNSWDFREDVKQLTIPVSYLFGRLDSIISVRIMEIMKITYPNFNYILFKKSAHMPFLSQPDEFIGELSSFIQ